MCAYVEHGATCPASPWVSFRYKWHYWEMWWNTMTCARQSWQGRGGSQSSPRSAWISVSTACRGWAGNVHSELHHLSPGPQGPDVLHCIGNVFNLWVIIPDGSPPDSPKVTLLSPSLFPRKTRPPNPVPLGKGESGIAVISHFIKQLYAPWAKWLYTGV